MNRKEEMKALADQIKAYFDDGPPNDGSHSDAAGATAFELLRSAEFALRASAAPEEGTSEFSTAEIIEHADYVHELANSAVSGIGQATGLRIERMLREFGALPSDSGKAAPVDMILARNYATSAMNVCIALADEVVCRNGTAEDVAKSLRIRAALAPATEGGGREEIARIIESKMAQVPSVGTFAHEQRRRKELAIEAADAILALSPSPSVGTGTQVAHREALPPAWLGDEGGGQ